MVINKYFYINFETFLCYYFLTILALFDPFCVFYSMQIFSITNSQKEERKTITLNFPSLFFLKNKNKKQNKTKKQKQKTKQNKTKQKQNKKTKKQKQRKQKQTNKQIKNKKLSKYLEFQTIITKDMVKRFS